MAISFVGYASGAQSATLPAHQAGDLILCFAFRSDGAYVPTVPSGWTTISSQTTKGSRGSVIAYKFAPGSGTSSDGWFNSTSVGFVIYRGVNATGPIGGYTSGASSLTSIRYNTVSMNVTNGSSWVVACGAILTTSSLIENAPGSMTNRVDYIGSSEELAIHDTNGGVSTWLLAAVSSGVSVAWSTWTIELIAATTQTYYVTAATTSTTVGGNQFDLSTSLSTQVGSITTDTTLIATTQSAGQGVGGSTSKVAAPIKRATAATAPSIKKTGAKVTAASKTASAALGRFVSKQQAAQKTVTAALVKYGSRASSAVAAATATVTSIKARLIVLVASVGQSAAISKAGRAVRQAVGVGGALVKKAAGRSLVGQRQASGSLTKQASKRLSSSAQGVPTITKAPSVARAAVIAIDQQVSKAIRLAVSTTASTFARLMSILVGGVRGLTNITALFVSMVVNGKRVVTDSRVSIVQPPITSQPNTIVLTHAPQCVVPLVYEQKTNTILVYSGQQTTKLVGGQ